MERVTGKDKNRYPCRREGEVCHTMQGGDAQGLDNNGPTVNTEARGGRETLIPCGALIPATFACKLNFEAASAHYRLHPAEDSDGGAIGMH